MASLPNRIGCWVKLPAVESVEILALAGVDLVVVDLVNSALTVADVSAHVCAARAAGVECQVRIPEDSPPSVVGRMLDIGAAGVIAPHVSTVEQARGYVAASFFPPQGSRGMGGTTRGGDWLLGGLDAYLASADRDRRRPLASIMIENTAALDAVESIAAIGGLGQLFVGPADLSVDLGVPGRMDHPSVLAAMDRVVAAGREHGVSVATAVGTAQAAKAMFARGFDTVVLSNDASLLGGAARAAFAAARTA